VDLPGGDVVEYVHDPLGRRIAKKVNGTVVEKYLWQGRTRLLAVYDGSGSLKQRFEYADGRLPVAMTKAGVRYFLVYDQVGSLRAVTDASGSVVKTVEYDSFGNVIADSDDTFTVPFGFAGGLFDTDTGLTRFGFRDYDADVGRWTAKDPILFEGGDTDLYGYVVGDPVNGVDPEGKFAFLLAVPFAGAATAALIDAAGVTSGIILGASLGGYALNNWFASSNGPRGSLPIDQTPWAGGHQEIKDGVYAGPNDNVRIGKDGTIYVQNPDGTWSPRGNVSDYPGTGTGKTGKQRDEKRQEKKDRRKQKEKGCP
jgi:RHS repeat-associated protein